MVGVLLRPAGRACAAFVLASFSLLVVGLDPAAADPTVTVTPSTNLRDGQTVELDLTGFDTSNIGGITECSAEILTTATPAWSMCRFPDITFGAPSHATTRVDSVFTGWGANGPTNCHVAPGCVVGWMDAGTTIHGFAPVSFVPDLRPTPPQRNLTDGTTVQVTVGGTPAGSPAVAQCDKGILDDPTPASADALCAPSTPVVSQPGGGLGADLVVHDPFTPVSGGGSRSCGYETCVIVLAPVGAEAPASVAISFGPTLLTRLTDEPVAVGDATELKVFGTPLAGVQLSQCRLPLGTSVATSQCINTAQAGGADSWGTLVTVKTTVRTVATPNDCDHAGCGFAVSDLAGNWLSAPVPVQLRFIDAEPVDQPFLDGAPIGINGEGLPAGSEYLVRHCEDSPERCDDGITVAAAADGTVIESIPARQVFTTTGGDFVLCRPNMCSIFITDVAAGQDLVGRPYTMADGSIAVAPDSGLGDGQTVQVTGTDLMPTYDGPAVWFPTGHWALTQCDAAVEQDQTLLGVFTHCAQLPPTRGVEIPGSTLDTTWDADATIHKILGGTTDCTASPGACVIGLVRWEADAQVTAHFADLSFGT